MAKAQSLAMAFGGMSAGIGAWYMAAPRHFLSVIGARPSERRILITRLVAAQELGVGTLLMADGRATPWLAMRVGGDLVHGAMLALAYRAPDADRRQMRLAWLAWLAITAGDVAGTLVARNIERTGADMESGDGESSEAALAVTDDAVHRSITIAREPMEVYSYWRQLENLPRFMKHLERVEELDGGRSRWTARAPLGATVEWEAEITDDLPGQRIAWTATEDAQVRNAGTVTFERAPGGRGTEVRVRLQYSPPGGPLGTAVAKLLGEDPSRQISGDLRRLKQVLETNEVVVSVAAADDRSRRQRPAQPVEVAR